MLSKKNCLKLYLNYKPCFQYFLYRVFPSSFPSKTFISLADLHLKPFSIPKTPKWYYHKYYHSRCHLQSDLPSKRKLKYFWCRIVVNTGKFSNLVKILFSPLGNGCCQKRKKVVQRNPCDEEIVLWLVSVCTTDIDRWNELWNGTIKKLWYTSATRLFLSAGRLSNM